MKDDKQKQLEELEEQLKSFTSLLKHCTCIHAGLSFDKKRAVDEEEIKALKETMRETKIDMKFLNGMCNSIEDSIKTLKEEENHKLDGE